MRERYDTLTAVAQCPCGAAMTMLKPERAKLDDLNAEHGMDGMNYFYICFGCKGIMQMGFPDTQEMDLSSGQ